MNSRYHGGVTLLFNYSGPVGASAWKALAVRGVKAVVGRFLVGVLGKRSK